jgi:hypothetical protein
MKTFIRATEVWVPTRDRALLELAGGLYGTASQFGAINRSMCFARGEGLPGRAWDEGSPIVLKNLEGSYFLRGVAARAAGLTCAIAVPLFLSDVLSAVLVFFCGDPEAHAGAIELWHNDPRVASDMTLVDGYYGTTSPAFESISHDTYLPRGSGLPGLAWQRGAAVLIDDLGNSGRFLRAGNATDVGMQRGLAIPCTTQSNETYVMTFLAGSATPIARRIESWTPDETRQKLRMNFGLCERVGHLPTSHGEIVLGSGQGVIGRAFSSGVPSVSEDASTEPGSIGVSAAAADLTSLVAIPIVSDDQVTEVAVLYF